MESVPAAALALEIPGDSGIIEAEPWSPGVNTVTAVKGWHNARLFVPGHGFD